MNETQAMLRLGTDAYRAAGDELEKARKDLTNYVRVAHAQGMKKADILRAIDHIWSRTWLETVLGEEAD